MSRQSLTYGTLPTREEYEQAFDKVVGSKCGGCEQPWPHAAWSPTDGIYHRPAVLFTFTNDPRVGTCALTRAELWRELEGAHMEWLLHGETGSEALAGRAAGEWCSAVLSVLGFEWV